MTIRNACYDFYASYEWPASTPPRSSTSAPPHSPRSSARGGLGDLIVAGLALSDVRMVLSGAVPAAVLALLVDAVLALTERVIRPGGVRI